MQQSVSIRDLSLNFGNVKVLERLNLDIAQGEFIVLLGPSGCGKSTLLNCIAGLLDVSAGQIFINGKNVTWMEPKDRGIGMVFQSYALYPQMSVEKNLSFGLRVSGMKKDEIDRRVKRASEILQIEPLLQRKPANLSGGQRQRVAIGRALVRDVDVFLFDEPLSNLDAKLRSDLRVEIKRLHQRLKNTMIYVTHDQIEALTLADRIAIMKNGVIQQLADPHTIYNKPTNLYVAGFIGSPAMNFIEGDLRDGAFVAKDGTSIPVGSYAYLNGAGSGPAVLGIRPEHIFVGEAAQGMPYQADVEIEIVEPMGSETLAWTTIAGKPVTFRCSSDIDIHAGDKMRVGFDVARGSLFDAKSENRL
ncbi:ABC transporter ATP-binding protein [Devosia sp. PTR5]|uniref:ABC transporter ATP-binding protein n=1 Tax=Devosia oryzisoli TaxID=2774138 RepID=A0A927ISM3_9HYPH|nr:ABC transporter ATP-binding protein [Devosia oryzisoli]MBD8064908.1 ABC transporter ATP-binding protein [Devosia oryzisoli]